MDYFDNKMVKYDVFTDELNNEIDLTPYDLIIKTPGISPNTLLLQNARKLQKQVVTDLELYYLLTSSTKIIGVTGSNGKTTVVTLLDRILNSSYHVATGGNIGIPLFTLIDEPKDISLIECSSFELYGTSSFKPHVWVILNIEHHHLDYHSSFSEYFRCKTKCISNMTEDDVLIYNYDDIRVRDYVKNIKVHKVSFSKSSKEAKIYLHHNQIYYDNKCYLDLSECMCKNRIIQFDFLPVIIVSSLYNIDKNIITNELINFESLEHRCEIVINNNSYVIINDSKATSPTATLGAFEFINMQFPKFEPLWIVGGKLTKDDYLVLNQINSKHVNTFIYGENKKVIENLLDKSIFKIQLFPNLKSIIEYIFSHDLTNKIILFSPSSPSYDMFKSFEERGKYFKELINMYDKKEL